MNWEKENEFACDKSKGGGGEREMKQIRSQKSMVRSIWNEKKKRQCFFVFHSLFDNTKKKKWFLYVGSEMMISKNLCYVYECLGFPPFKNSIEISRLISLHQTLFVSTPAKMITIQNQKR